MLGLRKNTARLFDQEGKLFIAALDHPQSSGVMEGLVDPFAVMELYARTAIGGFILNAGLFRHIQNDSIYNKKLIMRVSLGGSKFTKSFNPIHQHVVSKETVNQLGADAVVLMLFLGENDDESLQQAAKAIDYYHSLSIPVILEVLSSDFARLHDTDIQMTGGRIGAEIGADVMKLFYTPDFEKVVEGCPLPIILAGGAKGSNILETAGNAVRAGVKGFAFGRNIVQHDNPPQMIQQLHQTLKG